MAPEIVDRSELGYSFQVDIWAIGIIMYTMLIGREPFTGKDEEELCENIVLNHFNFPLNAISALAKDLIKKILEPSPGNYLRVF